MRLRPLQGPTGVLLGLRFWSKTTILGYLKVCVPFPLSAIYNAVGTSNLVFRNHLMYFHLYNGATYFHNCGPSGAKKGNFPPAFEKD